MLILSLIVSAGLLAIVNALAWKTRQATWLIIPIAGFVVVGFGYLGVGLTAVAVQGIALTILIAVWASNKGRKSTLAVASSGLTVGVYVVVYLLFVMPEQSKYAQLRAEFPIEDIGAKVPVPKLANNKGVNIGVQQYHELEELEKDVDYAASRRHAWMLQRLHEDTTGLFISSPGFGVVRMTRPSESWLRPSQPEPEPIAQLGPRDTSAGVEAPANRVDERKSLFDLHQRSFLDFVNPAGFGYVKSRHQVAGFVPHRFSEAPKAEGAWSLQTLDLIGLLMHVQPVAYVSEHLPRMDELKSAPTRELDAFESTALAELRQGEDLYVRQNDISLRMVGAIRAVKQCTTCHGCERGELLGAFAYTLQKR